MIPQFQAGPSGLGRGGVRLRSPFFGSFKGDIEPYIEHIFNHIASILDL